jgi:diguanylate cyclase (GGDEF)-like protein/PAS domain S-box-containing protein
MKKKATINLINFSIIPKDDPKQALRIRRFFMAAAAYFLWGFLGYISYLAGFVEWKAIAGLLIMLSIINITLYITFRTGLNMKMADPSLTAIQMCAAIILVMYGMYFAQEARGVLLLIYIIILLFGIFRLNTRSFLYISIFTLLTYGGVIVLLRLFRPQGVNFQMEYLQLVVLGIVLVTFSVIGGYISSLRTKISKDRSTIQRMTDNIQDVIFVLDMNLNYTYVSPSVKILMGYEPEEVLKQAPLDAISLSSLDLASRTLSEVMELEKLEHKDTISRTLQLEIKRKDGTNVWTETMVSFIRDKNQRPVGILGVMRDITERKKAESQREVMLEAIRQGEEKYRTILESIQEGYFEVDLNGKFTFCNNSMSRLTGCSKEELLGMNHKQFTNEETAKEVFQAFDNVYTTGEPSKGFDWQIIRKDGGEGFIEASVTLQKDSSGKPTGFKGMIRDITERKRTEQQINYMATHDVLTGLPNRLMFNQLLNQAIRSAQRHKRQLAVFFIDLDRFKIINDSLGHEAGDRLLKEMARRFKKSLRSDDVVGRLGGDEFVILIEEVDELSQVALVAHKILTTTIQPMSLQGEECRVTASIGISIYPGNGTDEQTLIKNADMAMYFAKEEGRNNYQFYSKDIQSLSNKRFSIETNLRRALERNELSLKYQAKVDFKTGMITGVEALLRWKNLSIGLITPTQFIPVAEETGLIVPIGRWVMKTACAQNVAWQRQGLPPVCMAVNLSLRQLIDDNLLEDIKAALDDSGMAPNLLELEITESMVMHNPPRLIELLTNIKKLGVRLAIDDFGTGYSSLAQIQHFPIDTLKVDRSFIRNLAQDSENQAITQAIITMGKTLKLTVVAEGVETQEQKDFLRDLICDEMQGFYFSKPIAPDQFGDLLRNNNIPSQK